MCEALTTPEIIIRLDGLERRFDQFEALLRDIAKENGKRDPCWLTLREAAERIGLSGQNPVSALRKRLQREALRPNGIRVRRRHGLIHRHDFNGYLHTLEKEQ